MKASIIILAYNQLENGTKPCIESVCKYTNPEDFELIVVDNNSSDNTAEYLKELKQEKQNVKIVLNITNRGYAGGNNDGIKLATGDYIILLNNDTLVTPSWLENLLKYFEQEDKIGLCGPVTNNASSVQCLNFDNISPDNYFEQSNSYTEKRIGSYFETNKLTFFCVAIKKELLQTVGLLDENYGRGYFEDDDFCRRAQNKGYKLICVEDSFVYHQGCLSFKDLKGKSFDDLMQKNKKYYQKKHKKYSVNTSNLKNFLYKIKNEINNYKNGKPSKQALEDIELRLNAFEVSLQLAKENEAYLTSK